MPDAASIIELREQGLSYQAIADALGTSRGSVWKALKGETVRTAPVTVRTVVHRCATPGCGAELRDERWIYSSHTGLRYCYTGDGCWNWSEKKRLRERERSQEVTT